MMIFSPMTYTLIAINVLVWLYMKIYLNHFSDIKLLDVGISTLQCSARRVVPSYYLDVLHFNFEHILMNMLSLFILVKL